VAGACCSDSSWPSRRRARVEAACRDRYLIVNAVAPDVLRLAPPLTVAEDEIERALERRRRVPGRARR
jgi:acetylornithine/succinyldiaminopimelate/putrescine aminotransferase